MLSGCKPQIHAPAPNSESVYQSYSPNFIKGASRVRDGPCPLRGPASVMPRRAPEAVRLVLTHLPLAFLLCQHGAAAPPPGRRRLRDDPGGELALKPRQVVAIRGRRRADLPCSWGTIPPARGQDHLLPPRSHGHEVRFGVPDLAGVAVCVAREHLHLHSRGKMHQPASLGAVAATNTASDG